MSCQHCEELVQGALDGALTPAERRALDDHLARCPRCRRALDEYRALARDVAGWSRRSLAAEDPGEAFTAGVMARVAARPAPAHKPQWLGWGLAGAVVVTLVLASSRLWPAAFGLSAPADGLLPRPQAALGLPDWLLENLYAVPQALTHALNSVTGAVALPSWVPAALLAALLVNGLCFLRATQAPRRRA